MPMVWLRCSPAQAGGASAAAIGRQEVVAVDGLRAQDEDSESLDLESIEQLGRQLRSTVPVDRESHVQRDALYWLKDVMSRCTLLLSRLDAPELQEDALAASSGLREPPGLPPGAGRGGLLRPHWILLLRRENPNPHTQYESVGCTRAFFTLYGT